MMCGPTGSGKTTFAKRLEREHNAVRMSVDEWMIALHGHHMPREVFDERLARIKDLLWNMARRLLELGVNVVLDFGFWKRTDRSEGLEPKPQAQLQFYTSSISPSWSFKLG